jgi:hypothetical protein
LGEEPVSLKNRLKIGFKKRLARAQTEVADLVLE